MLVAGKQTSSLALARVARRTNICTYYQHRVPTTKYRPTSKQSSTHDMMAYTERESNPRRLLGRQA